MDLGLSDNRISSFRLFQQRIINEYDKMVDEFGLTVIDGTLPVEVQQRQVRKIVSSVLRRWKGLPHPRARTLRSQHRRMIHTFPITIEEEVQNG